MSVSTIKKGKQRESYFSQYKTFDEVPVLISSKLLRQRGCGQVDLAFYHPKQSFLSIYEVKSNGVLGPKQKKRLCNSANLMGQLLNSTVGIKLL